MHLVIGILGSVADEAVHLLQRGPYWAEVSSRAGWPPL